MGTERVRHGTLLVLCTTKEAEQIDAFHVLHRKIGLTIDLPRTEDFNNVRVSHCLVELCLVYQHAKSIFAFGTAQDAFDDEPRRGFVAKSRSSQKHFGTATHCKPAIKPEWPKRYRSLWVARRAVTRHDGRIITGFAAAMRVPSSDSQAAVPRGRSPIRVWGPVVLKVFGSIGSSTAVDPAREPGTRPEEGARY